MTHAPPATVFDGTAVPLNGALLTVPLTGQPAIGWYIEVTIERTGRLKTTSTFTERDMSSPIGQTTTTRTDRIKTSSFDRQILTHRLVPFAVAVRGGGQVIVPATAGFDGVPVTGELKVARDLPPDLYDRLREVGEKNGVRSSPTSCLRCPPAPGSARPAWSGSTIRDDRTWPTTGSKRRRSRHAERGDHLPDLNE